MLALKEIRGQYFSDRLLRVWQLLMLYYERQEKMRTQRTFREVLLVRDFNVVFEDMIDYLLSDPDETLPNSLKDQPDGKLVDLPKEAGNLDAPRFEPAIDWLKTASRVEQKTAIWRWFGSHFDQHEEAAPHDGEGNFLFANNEHVMADVALREKFSGLVPDEVLETLISDVVKKTGKAWAARTVDKFAG